MKKLVINPKKEEITKEMKALGFDAVFGTLFTKVFQQEPKEFFQPLITKEGHIRRFVANVEPVRVAIQDYAGKEITDVEEGAHYLTKIGNDIYGDKQWAYRLIVNEVKYGRESSFYMETTNDELVKKLSDALEGIASVEYNRIKKVNRKNNKSETVTEPELTLTTDAQNNEQENANE